MIAPTTADAARNAEALEHLSPDEEVGVSAALLAGIWGSEQHDSNLTLNEQYLVVETSLAAIRAAKRAR